MMKNPALRAVCTSMVAIAGLALPSAAQPYFRERATLPTSPSLVNPRPLSIARGAFAAGDPYLAIANYGPTTVGASGAVSILDVRGLMSDVVGNRTQELLESSRPLSVSTTANECSQAADEVTAARESSSAIAYLSTGDTLRAPCAAFNIDFGSTYAFRDSFLPGLPTAIVGANSAGTALKSRVRTPSTRCDGCGRFPGFDDTTTTTGLHVAVAAEKFMWLTQGQSKQLAVLTRSGGTGAVELFRVAQYDTGADCDTGPGCQPDDQPGGLETVPVASGITGLPLPAAMVAGNFAPLAGNRTGVALALSGNSTIRVYLSDGTGVFSQSGASLAVAANPRAIATGDWNSDGALDLAVASAPTATSGTVSLYVNNGSGVFSPAGTFPCIQDPTGLVFGDFAGDGRQDLAVTGRTDGRATIYEQVSGGCTLPATWTSLAVAAPAPAARAFAAMATDTRRERVVMFGGYSDTAPNYLNETWEWDGHSWRSITTPAALLPRYSASLAYDSIKDRFVLFGGLARTSGGTFQIMDDTWILDATRTWQQLNPTTRPLSRYGHKMVFDETAGTVLLFGGARTFFPAPPQYRSDTWTFNGTQWTEIVTPGPTARKDFAMTYDAARRETILFGGTTGVEGSSYQQDTWRWNGSVWQELIGLTTRPPSRDNHAMAFDRNRGLVTLFGGSGSAEQNTTWEWNGVAWSARNTPGPVGRTGSAMAFDSARNGVLLFGGYAPSGSPFSAQASFYSGPVPVFSTQPIGGRVPPGTNVQLSAATSSSNVTFKWSRNGYELFDGGRISGTTTPMLSISAITLADEGIYTLVIAGACGSQISQAARLLVGGCVADFDDGSGTGTPDNGVGIEDLLYYLSIYDAGVSQADVDDGTGTGHFDGGVGIEDLLYYLARYDAGC